MGAWQVAGMLVALGWLGVLSHAWEWFLHDEPEPEPVRQAPLGLRFVTNDGVTGTTQPGDVNLQYAIARRRLELDAEGCQ